jgi:hypothetical protein
LDKGFLVPEGNEDSYIGHSLGSILPSATNHQLQRIQSRPFSQGYDLPKESWGPVQYSEGKSHSSAHMLVEEQVRGKSRPGNEYYIDKYCVYI